MAIGGAEDSKSHVCYRGSNGKRQRRLTVDIPKACLSRCVAIAVLCLTIHHQSCAALLLSPMPGYFLTSALLKKKSIKTNHKNNNNNKNKKHRIKIQKHTIASNGGDGDDNSSSLTTSSPSSRIRPPTANDSLDALAATTTSAAAAAATTKAKSSDSIGSPTSFVRSPPTTYVKKPTSEKDILIARAAKLRQTIVRQQDELITLERRIACCFDDGRAPDIGGMDDETSGGGGTNIVISGISDTVFSSSSLVTNLTSRLVRTFEASSKVLLRKIDRVQKKVGPNNQQYEGKVGAYLFNELFAGLRIASKLATEPTQIKQLVSDPRTPTLVPHAPAILARLDRLEPHVRPIIEGVLNDKQHLASIEPYLDEILERFDDIEPHLPWILQNIDALAPYTGLLLKHIDALLLYADADNMLEEDGSGSSSSKKKYSLADQLLPYLEYYVSKLDTIGPHLVLLRPHIPLLLKHNRIAKVSPHIDKLFARGYESRLAASANIDVLLFWFGWTLRIPFAPALFFALPWSPFLVSFLANRLPKKFARRGKSYCRNLECAIDVDYGGAWNKLDKA